MANRSSPYGGKGTSAWGKDNNRAYGGNLNIKTVKRGLLQAGVLPGGQWANDENALFVSGLPPDTADCDMYEIFSTFGAIPARGVKAMINDSGDCTGIGFVNYMEERSAKMAIQSLNGTLLPDGSQLKVKVKGPPKPKEDKPREEPQHFQQEYQGTTPNNFPAYPGEDLDEILAGMKRGTGGGASFRVGSRVEIRGLKSNSDLNGKAAEILKLDEASGRWELRIEGTGQHIRCKPENIVMLM